MKKLAMFAVLLSFGLFMCGCGQPAVKAVKPPTPEQDAEWRKKANQDDPPPKPDNAPATPAPAAK